MFERTHIATAAVVALGGALLAGVTPVQAQESTPQRIEITGTAIKRVDAETSLPVTVMKHEDIERTGATTAQDLVNLIPSNFGGSVVANNVGATGAASTANLRSLGAKYTLVLLNGRRVANFAFGNSPVDLNSIPVSAVERVEVLRDGASAIYGADAVAGVINFILRKDYKGIEASVYDTHVAQGGGNTKVINITGGFGDLDGQGFNILLSANHEEDERLKATQRAFGSTAVRPDLGINKSSSRNGIPNFNFTDTQGNGYGNLDASGKTPTVNPYRAQDCNNPAYGLAIIDATRCGTDYVKFIDLLPDAKHDNVVAHGTFQVNSDLQLYAEATYTKDHTVATYSPAPYTRPMTYPAGGRFYPADITLPAGMTLPAGYKMPDGSVLAQDTTLTQPLTVHPTGPMTGTWRTVAGGGRQDITDTENTRFLVGAQGSFAGWDYDTAMTFSRNHGEISFGNGQYSYSALAPLLAAGKINVFGDQDQQSLADLASAQLHGLENDGTSTSEEIDFHMSKEIARMTYGAVGLAIGASARHEKLIQNSEPVMASGDQVGGNGPVPGVAGSRKVYGLFTELTVPLYKALDLDVAARYDNYKNSFGTSFNKLSPKASIRFQPIKELVLRASFGEGYRAPTLYENLLPFTSGNNTNANWSDPVRCPNGTPISNTGLLNPVDPNAECNIQLPAAFSGATDLKPEQSKQFSLGMAFSPTADLSGSLDYWDVRISDAILRKSEVAVLSNEPAFRNFYYRYDPHDPANWCTPGDPTSFDPTCADPTHAIQGGDKNYPLAYVYLPYENAAKVFSAGIDVNLNYRLKTGVGNFMANLDGTYFTKHGYQYNSLPEVSDLGAYKDFQPVPRWRHALTFTWVQGPWNASLTHNYTASYTDYFDPTETPSAAYPADRKVDAYQTVDATFGWTGIKGLDLTLGVKNLFDTDPPSSRTAQNFQTGYDATYTNPLGRMYYLRARYKFF